MSEVIATDVQHLSQDPVVVLFELDASRHGQGVLRWTNEAVDGGPARFNGYEYTPLPIEADGFEWSGKGPLPQPTLRVSAMELAFLSLVLAADDLLGCPVRRIRTFRQHLDDGRAPDPLATFPVDHYAVERKSGQTSTAFEFTLAAPMDQEGLKLPARQVLRDTCTHTYRWWDGAQYRYEGVTCPYAGDGEWEASGAVATPGQGDDVCGKRLSDCRLRFGQNAVLPTRAFPGVGRVR
ncbi:phage minor tail protein L [Halomonas sp. I1]|uniref:phage minor tail protein L n=1 Tax=Halomonas sp. I1 TaxID=393536 RepID=UPI0028DF085A|nr:phage minor tail protein L [Halomonas sp. I1]MDT8894176.1 phage minor tail protein L [Halomonas sp. I1]